MIQITPQNEFHLSTKETSYVFRVTKMGHLEHLYYGTKITPCEAYPFLAPQLAGGYGDLVAYSQEDAAYIPDAMRLEYGSFGKGDYKEPAIQVSGEDGCFISDFLFEKASTSTTKPTLQGLPSSEGESETLIIKLHDNALNADLELFYTVFEACNVITRSARLTNWSPRPVKIHSMMSAQVDLPPDEYTMLTFDGIWLRERHKNEKKLNSGTFSISSNVGTSSNRHNPFFALKVKDCNEQQGSCYGFNLVYSGNHIARVEVSPYQIVRVQNGINPFEFEWKLQPKGVFDTPESIMTFSNQGLNGMSQNMHHFVQDHIVRGEWQYKERPVLVNNWEATYFQFNEKKILSIAKSAKELGAEMFVLDDGWFGKRNSDHCSLGDWNINMHKLPRGLDSMCKKINDMGLMFGLWVEPEMVSPDSDLYRAHPDWVLATEKYTPSQGRNQMVLDLTRKEICDYLIDVMTDVFKYANIEYIKWDMNRHLSDTFSKHLGTRQGEVYHRYVMGLYYIMDALVSRFPHILFESCSSGGNRFDLGMFCYMPQTWTSDDTDCYERVKIQAGTSYGYPLSCITAHVSGTPSFQDFRASSVDSRFNVAAFGLLGYEMDVTAMSPVDKAQVKKQIAYYKEHRKLLQFGNFYRVNDCFQGGNMTYWQVVSPDQKEAVLFHHQDRLLANQHTDFIKFVGLDENKKYDLSVRRQIVNIRTFGEIINQPMPVKLDLEENKIYNGIADRFTLKTEKEEYQKVPGDALMGAGFLPKQQFVCGGFNILKTRLILDNDSRLYYLKESEAAEKK